MILDDEAMRWELEVLAAARRAGWTTYPQDRRSRRQHDPSCVLVRPGRLLLVFLRMNRRHPPALANVSAYLGVEAVLWTPADRAAMTAEMGMRA